MEPMRQIRLECGFPCRMYPDLSEDEYHGLLGPVSASVLKHAAQEGWLEAWAAMVRPKKKEAYTVGSYVHACLFEPDEIERRYGVLPGTYIDAKGVEKKWNGNATVCKTVKVEMEARGLDVLKADDWARGVAMREEAGKQPWAKEVFGVPGQAECSIIWETGGIPAKTRVDWLSEGHIYDYKTTASALAAFERFDFWKYRYDLAAAFYVDAVKHATGKTLPYTLIVQRKAWPYECGLFHVGEDTIAEARKLYAGLVEQYIRCATENIWPGVIPDAGVTIHPRQFAPRSAAKETTDASTKERIDASDFFRHPQGDGQHRRHRERSDQRTPEVQVQGH